MRLRPASILTFALVASTALAACGGEVAPRAVVEGEDACAHCHMGVADLRFAAQARTTTGKVLLFDSVECLADYVQANPSTQFAALHVTDYAAPGSWLRVEDAQFVADGTIVSPMGRSLAAFDPEMSTAALVAAHAGRVVPWSEVLSLVAAGEVTAPHDHAGMP